MAEIIDVPVLIVGGGSCGLSLSCFLSNLNVEHILFEAHEGTSILPKAHVINQRTMEIFRQHGIADAIVEKGTPPRQMSQIIWQTSLGGDGPLDRKVIGTHDTWGCKFGTERYTTYQRDAPIMPSNLPLLRSEPIFRAIAEERNPGKIFYSHKVTDFKDEGEHVIVHVENKDGQKSTYRARYLIGADGGKTVGPKLGIEMEGPKQLRNVVSTHFKADLSQYWDDRTCIAHFANPEGGALFRSGSMLPLGPTWGRYSEEWQMHFSQGLNDPPLAREDAAPRIRALLKMPDLKLELLTISNWVQERVLASRYQQGRIFIGGDAAHRHPPTTGLGLNTAVQDAHNLAWKLSYVLKGKASTKILDTYEPERRAIGKRNCDWAFFTWKRHAIIGAAIGLQPDQIEANKLHFTNMFDEKSEIGQATRASLQHVINGQVVEFGSHDMDLGFIYPKGAFIPDGTSPPLSDPTRQKYTPTTRPGHRMPHSWVERNGTIYSTTDLVGPEGDFALITDRQGGAWIEAAKKAVKARSIGLRVVQITEPYQGVENDEYLDSDAHWAEIKGIGNGGAILVRPDNIIGWRSIGKAESGPQEILSNVFDTILTLQSVANGDH